jgi:hypothetical protein
MGDDFKKKMDDEGRKQLRFRPRAFLIEMGFYATARVSHLA